MMDTKTSPPPARYRIEKIEQLEFLIAPKPSGFSLDIEGIEVGTKTGLRFEPDSNSILIHFDVMYIDKKSQKILMNFEAQFTFRVENFKEAFVSIDDNKIQVDDSFVATIMSISLSTVRGMIFTKVSETYLANAYFPIYDAHEIARSIKSGDENQSI